MRLIRSLLPAAAGAAALTGLMATGRLTLDANVMRTEHELGPLVFGFAAPRELVYQQLSSPYLGRTPRELRLSLEVVERGTDMVLARHYTDLGNFTSETLELVKFEEPSRITFRHVRGPVPHAIEWFELDERDGGAATQLTYGGELGIDWGVVGQLVARFYAVPTWENAVTEHLEGVRQAVEERAAARARRGR